MKSDLPFIVTVKASNIYDDNDRYSLINNLKNKELINYIREYIVFVNEGGGEYSARLYYNYYIYLSLIYKN
uniref:Uncharacterized protein n=1 Tax=Myoviridae sp. ctJ2i1 TaxID=2825079 RepID=A0A8S5V221_9CAUD|nr:MAG TPA: hypothetical protein [Myoviridae sp. ctJ2i1]